MVCSDSKCQVTVVQAVIHIQSKYNTVLLHHNYLALRRACILRRNRWVINVTRRKVEMIKRYVAESRRMVCTYVAKTNCICVLGTESPNIPQWVSRAVIHAYLLCNRFKDLAAWLKFYSRSWRVTVTLCFSDGKSMHLSIAWKSKGVFVLAEQWNV